MHGYKAGKALLTRKVNDMQAYAKDYLKDVVENQGKLFDFVAQTYPDKDTRDFINMEK